MKHYHKLSLFVCFHILVCVMGSNAQGFLKTSGKFITNGKGEEILLRGMGLGGWMLQEPYMLQLSGVANNQADIRKKIAAFIGPESTELFYKEWLANHCTRADIDSMKAWGFNSVRLPMHYNLYTLPVEEEPVKGQYTWLKKGFEMTDSLLSWCKANEIYLILDLHAAPGGQGTDYAISDRDTLKPSLWQSEANQQKTIALWRKLAERYAKEEWIGGYDLINETNWGFQSANDKNGCSESANQPLRKLLVDITEAIREVDKDHMIFIEGNCWANNYKGIFPLWDNNMVISFHKYWNDNNQASIQQFIELREQHNAPLWMGESGENSNAWFRSAIALLEQNKIGWAWWPLKKLGMNNPLQVPTNTNYQKLVTFWKDSGPKPSREEAFKGLMQLARDSRIDKNIYHKDVVDAMFRQVKGKGTLPFASHHIQDNPKIYAVNYDLGRNGEAYYSIDSANYWVTSGKRTQWNKGWTYRNDAVDIKECKDPGSNGFQVTSITPAEWLQYTFSSGAEGAHTLRLRVNADTTSSFDIVLNGKTVSHNNSIAPGNGAWLMISIPNLNLSKGSNQLRITGRSGDFSLCSLEFYREKPQPLIKPLNN